MDLNSYLPVSGWKQTVGLVAIIILVVVLARRFGVTKKVSKVVGG